MDAIAHFRRLFAYDDWANREVLASLYSNPNPRSLELLAHIFAAQWVWLDRLKRRPQSVAVWPTLTLETCKAHADELDLAWQGYFDETPPEGMAQSTTYKNTRGEAFTSRNDDILTHVLMHGAYHRGQIASAIRGAGKVPVTTDFIHCIRLGLVE